MQVIEVIAVKLGYPPIFWVARDEVEAGQMAIAIQAEGGLPLARYVEVRDDFNKFTIKLPGAIPEPSLN
jgi:hypothetical protein